MKHYFQWIIAAVLALVAAGCSLQDLAEGIEPSDWNKKEFEKSVRQAMRRAVNSPGIDNGTTLVVTVTGDTLIAPSDTSMSHLPQRIVYVDLQSPDYPKGVPSKVVGGFGVVVTILGLALVVFMVVLMAFIMIMRRQAGRNKLISQAIEAGYQLPESFYTNQPKSATVKVTQTFGPRDNSSDCRDSEPCSTVNETASVPLPSDSELSKAINLKGDASRVKQLRDSFILIGLGVILFLAFASSHETAVGFFVGGVLVVFGGAKLLTLYLSRKF